MKVLRCCLFFFLYSFLQVNAEMSGSNLMDDLLLLKELNKEIYWRFPVHHNHLQVGGYMMMPSSRVGCEGEVAFQYMYTPPYTIWSGRFTPFENFEVSANYRLLHGMEDPVLTPMGFGDRSDKGANIKFVITHPEESDYWLPGVAIGAEDFFGTKTYNAAYIVATQIFKPLNAELTIGYGDKRIQGLFGGALWMPFLSCCDSPLKPLALCVEYDAIRYSDTKWEPHPESQEQKSPFNVGGRYNIGGFALSVDWMRGKELAIGGSFSANLGHCSGFIPKIHDPLPYTRPVLLQPISSLRNKRQFIEELTCAFKKQKMQVRQIRQLCDHTHLVLVVENEAWLNSDTFKKRVLHLLGALVPDPFTHVTVYVEGQGMLSHYFTVSTAAAREYLQCKRGFFAIEVEAPNKDVCCCPQGELLFLENQQLLCPYVQPDIHNFFGSAKGKYKYSVGVAPGIEGYLPAEVYYNCKMGIVLSSDIAEVGDFDVLNPSQVINVRSDILRYYKQRGITFHELYIQKNFTFGSGFFSRFSFGHFERQYGGVATEFLYYPIDSCFAFGIEGAALMKRNVKGLGVTNKIRKLNGIDPTYEYLLPIQYFATLYYHQDQCGIEASVKAGQFLARDIGAKFEVSKIFENGVKVGFWYTPTNGKDYLNAEHYHDKGIIVSIPLDMLRTCSYKKKIEQRMAAWTRDVGQYSLTGKPLYPALRIERFR